MASPTRTAALTTVAFTATVESIDDRVLVRLPAGASAELPSRGQVAVRMTVDGRAADTVVEPDGRRGHWLRLDDLPGRAVPSPGDEVAVTLEVRSQWPEPEVPDDLRRALDDAPADIAAVWEDITPMARWEWVRWVGATANPSTRQRRVEVSLSKMAGGKRRPCCFDLASCTDPELARSGRLRDPD